jgi:hypothetical protein
MTSHDYNKEIKIDPITSQIVPSREDYPGVGEKRPRDEEQSEDPLPVKRQKVTQET